MKKVLFISIGIALLLMAIMIGATRPSNKDQVDVTAGSWDNNAYHNDYFGLEFYLPGRWEHESSEPVNNEDVKDQDNYLLTRSVGKNKAFAVLAGKLDTFTAMLHKEDDMVYLRKALDDPRMKSLFLKDDIVLTIEPDITNKNGVKFVPAQVKMIDGNQVLSGKLLVTRKKDYLLVFVFLGTDNAQKGLDEIADSISFE